MEETIDHPLLGLLEPEAPGSHYHVKEETFWIFGDATSIKVCVCVADYPFEPNQEEAIQYFVKLREEFGEICENAIREHCQRILEEREEPRLDLVAADNEHVRGHAVIFPAFEATPTWGLTCNVKWTDKGLGIKFVRDKIVEIGMEDILI